VVKAIVVYESKYGNTKLAAESVVEGLNQVSGTEVKLAELNDVDLTQIGEFDMVLVGSPNHIGRATRSIRKFIDELGNTNLNDLVWTESILVKSIPNTGGNNETVV